MEKTSKAIHRIIRYFSTPKNKQSQVRGFTKYCKTSNLKRALLVYKTSPLVDLLQGKKITQFSNDGAVISIARSLNELGYSVDVINWDDKNPDLEQTYDLIVCHGAVNYEKVRNKIKNDGKLIYYSTGSYWKHHNKKEKERLDQFYQRHKVKLNFDRPIQYSEEKANKESDLVIALGNKDTAKTYEKFKNVKYLHAASMDNSRDVINADKNYDKAKKNFLFMSGPGGIHKGLDWAIDYFLDHPELNLHIMMGLEKDFQDFYSEALSSKKNIHYYGYVPQRTKQFYRIVDKCAASILLSCSEGSPGSVIESMHQGLLPIVTKDSHIDVGDCGITIKKLSFSTLDKAVQKIVKMNANELKQLSKKSYTLMFKEYTVEKYEDKLKNIIRSVIGEAK